jgi:hypothetical protein
MLGSFIRRSLAPGFVIGALLLVSGALTASQAEARQTSWGNNSIAASGCDTFVTPTYSWVSMHTRLSQYLCWGNGRITYAAQPQESCWVDWHGRAIGIKCSASRAYTQVSNFSGSVPISRYSRGEFTFSQCISFICTGQWRPAVSIRLRAADRIVTTYAWSR